MRKASFDGWGAELGADAFARAVAAAGVLRAQSRNDPGELGVLLDEGGIVPWYLDERPVEIPHDARDLAAAWAAYAPPVRLRLHVPDTSPLWLVRELGRRGVGLSGLSVAAPMLLPPPEPLEHHAVLGTIGRPIAGIDRDLLHVDLSPGPGPADLVVLPDGYAEDVLPRLRAGIPLAQAVAVLSSRAWTWVRVQALLRADPPGGLAAAHLPDAARGAWLNAVVRALDIGAPLDVALLQAAHDLELPPAALFESARRLPDGVTRRVLPDDYLDEVDYSLPSQTKAQQLRDFLVLADQLDDSPSLAHSDRRSLLPERPPPPPAPRYLLGRLRRTEDNAPLLAVHIGPPRPGYASGITPLPEPDTRGRAQTLQVALTVPALLDRPLVRALVLPSDGPSQEVAFALPDPGDERTRVGRLTVTHGGRILQTARVELRLGEVRDVRLVTEALVRRDFGGLDHRRRFDASIVVNHNDDGTPGATIVKDADVEFLEPARWADAERNLNLVLEDAVTDEREFSGIDDPAFAQVLSALAHHGITLNQRFGDRLRTHGIDRPERLQILSARPDARLPLELLYDGPPPTRERVCPAGIAQLSSAPGVPCPSNHADGTVCPLGFWGSHAVIERHATAGTEEVLGPAWTAELRADPRAGRERLPRPSAGVFAAHGDVDGFASGTIARLASQLTTVLPGGAPRVGSWDEWSRSVEGGARTLLLAIAHTTERFRLPALELSPPTDQLIVSGITRRHVVGRGGAPPIVLLLGCSTATKAVPFQNFPEAFRRHGAAIVVGTLTDVLGRHAGPLAGELVTELTVPGAPDVTVGECLLRLRRKLLAQGQPLAFAVTAFGDADWLLTS